MNKEITNKEIFDFLENKNETVLNFKKDQLNFLIVKEGKGVITINAEHESREDVFSISTVYSNDKCVNNIEHIANILSVH